MMCSSAWTTTLTWVPAGAAWPLTIKKSDGTADGVRNPLVPLDTETGNVYDMNGRRVWGKPQKGVYIRQGKKTLVK